jgi:hypothetical protein
MKLYTYCVTTLDTKMPDGMVGVFGRTVYPVTSGGVTAFVSDVLEDSLAVNKENVVIHQSVVGAVLEQTTPLPFRFGTIVGEPELTSYLISRQGALLKKLASVEGCVEMSVKIIWQKGQTRERAAERSEGEQGGGAGSAFLRMKRDEIVGSEQLIDEANQLGSWIRSQLGSLVREVLVTVSPSERLVVTADCLVERLRLDSYRAAAEKARSERPDLHFLTSGPWAPYSFANIDLEFKS